MRFAFIAEQDALPEAEKAYSVNFMCQTLKVSRQGYYQWKKQQDNPSEHARRDAELTERIKDIHHEHDGRFGIKRLYRELNDRGMPCSPKRVRRLARGAGLACCHPRPYKVTTEPGPNSRGLVDLAGRDFNPEVPDELWAGDITYIRCWDGWAYLATVIDCFSRKVIGWSIKRHYRTDLIEDAVKSAIYHRGGRVNGVVFHSDRGSNYTSHEFRDFCLENRIIPSVGRTGSCFDNAVSESFFATIKKELIHRHPWPDITLLRRAVFEYIESYYNSRRKHSANDYKTPKQAEELLDNQVALAA